MKSHDDLGDRMKGWESVVTSKRLNTTYPIYARIDGRGFSKFTKGMKRPYSPEMHHVMVNTTKALVKETNATFGYTQSDEISLGWVPSNNPDAQFMFDGKIQKLCSVLSGIATINFYKNLMHAEIENLSHYLEKSPHFDCRIFNVPDADELTNALYWRFKDCEKNAVSMAARSHFSHKELQGKGSLDMIQMMKDIGVNFYEYPDEFLYGTFVQSANLKKHNDDGEEFIRTVIVGKPVDFAMILHDARKELILQKKPLEIN